VRGVAVKLCPVYSPRGEPIPGTSPGELRGSIHTKVEQDAEKTVGCVYTNKEYAAYVGIWNWPGRASEPCRNITGHPGGVPAGWMGMAG